MAKTPNLFDTFSCEGFWWFPDNPDERLAGTLLYDPENGIQLNLTTFEEAPYPRPIAFSEIIQGCTAEGKIITLLYCHLVEKKSSALPVALLTYEVEFLIIGDLYDSPQEIRFSYLSVNYTNLEEWLWTSWPFDTESTTKDAGERHYEAQYSQPEAVKIIVPSIEARIDCGFTLAQFNDRFRKLDWEQVGRIVIRPDVPQQLDWFLKKVRSISNLLAVLMGAPVYTKSIMSHGREIDYGDEKKSDE